MGSSNPPTHTGSTALKARTILPSAVSARLSASSAGYPALIAALRAVGIVTMTFNGVATPSDTALEGIDAALEAHGNVPMALGFTARGDEPASRRRA